jgi:hypothetical protein
MAKRTETERPRMLRALKIRCLNYYAVALRCNRKSFCLSFSINAALTTSRRYNFFRFTFSRIILSSSSHPEKKSLYRSAESASPPNLKTKSLPGSSWAEFIGGVRGRQLIASAKR